MGKNKLSLDLENLVLRYPVLRDMIDLKEIFWTNDEQKSFELAMEKLDLNLSDVKEAEGRLKRFAPYLMKAFPETAEDNGIIESPVVEILNMQKEMEAYFEKPLPGKLYLKCDNQLKISGSIKARGGIYEVLKYAEELAIENGKLKMTDNYDKLHSPEMKKFYSKYTIQVGSTGNLGLSIGIISAKLGFKVIVHMSSDAKKWKKELLRSVGVEVIEYDSDYSKAVTQGRKESDKNPKSYFIDDENSVNLFMGYSVAALRLEKQLKAKNIIIDKDHPLFVYLPCGVGGGPGGVAFGLKQVFKDNVHFFFAEPTHSPCMTMGLLTHTHDQYSVQEFGIDNITDADGLAVGRASGFVGKTLEEMVSGSYSVSDENMYRLLKLLIDMEGIKLEPSALAGVYGIEVLLNTKVGKDYIKNIGFENNKENIVHLAWATGGGMVPEQVMEGYYRKGKVLI